MDQDSSQNQDIAWSGLDAALLELGMLSRVTEARTQFLKEKLHNLHAQNTTKNPGMLGASSPSYRSGMSFVAPWESSASRCQQKPVAEELEDIENDAGTVTMSVGNSQTMASPGAGFSMPSPHLGNCGKPGGYNVLQMNSQYVTGVSVGKMKGSNTCTFSVMGQPIPSPSRLHHLKPYDIPWRREERVRTRSENTDVADVGSDSASTALETSSYALCLAEEFTKPEAWKGVSLIGSSTLYKSRSMEDVRILASPQSVEEKSLPTREVEVVSRQIQTLRVNE